MQRYNTTRRTGRLIQIVFVLFLVTRSSDEKENVDARRLRTHFVEGIYRMLYVELLKLSEPSLSSHGFSSHC